QRLHHGDRRDVAARLHPVRKYPTPIALLLRVEGSIQNLKPEGIPSAVVLDRPRLSPLRTRLRQRNRNGHLIPEGEIPQEVGVCLRRARTECSNSGRAWSGNSQNLPQLQNGGEFHDRSAALRATPLLVR